MLTGEKKKKIKKKKKKKEKKKDERKEKQFHPCHHCFLDVRWYIRHFLKGKWSDLRKMGKYTSNRQRAPDDNLCASNIKKIVVFSCL